MLKEKLVGLSYAQKRFIQIVVDIGLIWLAMWLAFYIRLAADGWVWPVGTMQALYFYLAPVVFVPFFIRMGMYRAVMRFFGNDALLCIFKAVSFGFGTFVLVLILLELAGVEITRSRAILFMYWSLSLCLLGGVRLAARQYFMGNWFSADKVIDLDELKMPKAIPVAIYGAGAAGNQLLASIRLGRVYTPVAFVDENPALTGRLVSGLPVYAPDQVGRMIDSLKVQELFLAIPSASRAHKRKVLDQLQQYPLHVRTIPNLTDIATGKVKVEDLQEVDVADLLGREPVAPDPTLFERCIAGQSVMVTGAGGSIGSELCRQIVRAGPATLILYEHSEFALYAIHSELLASITELGVTLQLIPFLGSIRNESRLQHAIDAWDVDTIYHAAAFKHVPIVEHNVAEGIMNNLFGTLNVAQAAIRAGVKNFVLISTDKAVRPTNVMGATKRLAEMILQALSAETRPHLRSQVAGRSYENHTRFTMVRFGNVLGSSGSVIPLFREQIRQGGPITVTHPEINRYFMTIPEAAQLVIQAGSMGLGGDVFVLDMGEPVNIVDLARKMVTLSGLSVIDEENANGDIAIAFTGLRPGEKLYEELLIGENPQDTGHPKIFRANEAFLSWADLQPVLDELHRAVKLDDYVAIREILVRTVQGYKPADCIVDLLYEHHKQIPIERAGT